MVGSAWLFHAQRLRRGLFPDVPKHIDGEKHDGRAKGEGSDAEERVKGGVDP